MLNTVCQKNTYQKSNATEMSNMVYQVTQRKSWDIKKTKEKSEYDTVPKQFKTN